MKLLYMRGNNLLIKHKTPNITRDSMSRQHGVVLKGSCSTPPQTLKTISRAIGYPSQPDGKDLFRGEGDIFLKTLLYVI